MSQIASAIIPAHSRTTRIAVGATLVVLVVTGLVHRSLLAQIQGALGQSLKLSRPLSVLPLDFGPWQGHEVPIDDRVRRIAGEDDFINREYSNDELGRAVALYVGYIGRPRSHLSHRPDICYPAHGFQESSCESVLIPGRGGTAIPSLVYEFRSPEPGGPRDLVLVVYLVNGHYATNMQAIDGYNARSPSLLGSQYEPPYLTRIQASMRIRAGRAQEVSVLSDFVAQIAEPIVALMPG